MSILNTAQMITISINNGGAVVTADLYVTAKPIIYSVTDAAALTEPTPGAKPNVSPYELITIFGNNFCPTCAAPVVAPVVSSRYPTSLTAPVSGGHALTVTFYKSDGTTLVGDAYLLFANNTQINALVPSGVVVADNPMQVVVSYNGVLSNTNVLYEVNGAPASPGIFTTTSNGQGQGAILLADYSVNSATNPAIIGDKVAGTVLIYASGLGVPNSASASVTSTKAPTFPTLMFLDSELRDGGGSQPRHCRRRGARPSKLGNRQSASLLLHQGLRHRNHRRRGRYRHLRRLGIRFGDRSVSD